MRPALINGGVWLVAGIVVGVTFSRLDWRYFRSCGPFTRLREVESRSFYQRRLYVRAWKDRLPEAGTWFGGVSKRRIPGTNEGGRERLAAESLRAERVHWILLLLPPLSVLWSSGWWLMANVVVGIALNVPCIIVTRYNRVRLTLLT